MNADFAARRRRFDVAHRWIWAVCITGALFGCSDEAPGGGASDVGPVAADTGPSRPEAGVPSDASRPIDMGGVRPDAGLGRTDAAVADTGDAGPHADNPLNENLDSDCDGLSDAYEFSTRYGDGRQTDPANPDSDGDGIVDGIEVGRTSAVVMSGCPALSSGQPPSRTLPTNPDTDGDGISDGLEDANRNGAVDALELDPRRPDTDGDGLPDALEDRNRNGQRDPNETHGAVRDTDGDGIEDGVEDRDRDGSRQADESDPLLPDTDGDGLGDNNEDSNANGVRELFETFAYDPDTDCDGVSDGDEINIYGTSPLVPDTDGDGVTDGVEVGITSGVPGAGCTVSVAVDADPTTTTDPLSVDTDGDGFADGQEDSNRNGRVDGSETDPRDPNDPAPDESPGIAAICAESNLKVVAFASGSVWTLATETSMAATAVQVDAPGSAVAVTALDDANGIAGFLIRMPLLGGTAASATAQATALNGRAAAGADDAQLSWSVRLSGRSVSSHDGYEATVSTLIDVGATSGTPNAATVRNRLVALLTDQEPSVFSGLPADTGDPSSAFVLSYELLVRSDPQQLLLVGTVMPAANHDDPDDNRSIEMADLTNGTALAGLSERPRNGCDSFVAEGRAARADFIWMADTSGSTDDDRTNISNAAQTIFDALALNNVDFRMGVVSHIQNEPRLGSLGGTLTGAGFVRDRDAFVANLEDTTDNDGCEFGLSAARDAISRALPRTALGAEEDPARLRADATVAVIYISDEYAQEITRPTAQDCFGYDPGCDTGIDDLYEPDPDDESVCLNQPTPAQQTCIDSVVGPFIEQLQSPQVEGIAFAQVIPAAAVATGCGGYACPQQPGGPEPQPANEPGLGYTQVVNATGGAFYTPCNPDPGAALTAIVDAVSGASSSFELSGAPISATIRVGVVTVGGSGNGQVDIVPRDKTNGFDYDPAANAIFFRGTTFRPQQDDRVVISYRSWRSPCGDCPPGQQCDAELGVCVCSPQSCEQCGATEDCDGSCNCVCGADCNGQCTGNTVCNPETCQCECPTNCGDACGPGEVCNAACECECAADCGGACEGTNLECNPETCACECTDCGGECTGGLTCNTSSCQCDCPADCDAGCSNLEVCNPANGCACECPEQCGDCPDGSICNEDSCACECPAGCDETCSNNERCDPNAGCNCVCPADCGGCSANETCDAVACQCVPAI